MAIEALDNLVRIRRLKSEASNPAEVLRMLTQAKTRWADAQQVNVSIDGRFASIYGAAHAAALAALRWHGYRSENRFMVFQCLVHTLEWPANRWRVLDLAHQKRNLAEYEGYLDIEESMVLELIDLVRDLIADVEIRNPVLLGFEAHQPIFVEAEFQQMVKRGPTSSVVRYF